MHTAMMTALFTIGTVMVSTGTAALSWTLRISSGVSKGIYKSVVQSDREFLRIGVGDR